jgi:hypothetical protein
VRRPARRAFPFWYERALDCWHQSEAVPSVALSSEANDVDARTPDFAGLRGCQARHEYLPSPDLSAHYWAMVRRGLWVGARHCVALVALASTAAIGCGGDDGTPNENVPAGENSGQVTAPWTAYCVATFTRDFPIIDGFGDSLFTAKTGEKYLLSEFSATQGSFELVYLANGAPNPITVEGEASMPFTTNCEAGVTSYYAVFQDTAVFKDEALTEKACDLAAGTVLPADASKQRGYSSTDFSFGATAKYSVFLNAFSPSCGNIESGYISVPQVQVLGTATYLVPVTSIIGPAAP